MPKTYQELFVLGWLLYVFAGLVLIAGIMGAVSLYNGAQGIAGLMPMMQAMGGQEVGGVMGGLLRPFFIGLGNVALVTSILFSLLLFACGALVHTVRSLSLRVQRLELTLDQK